MKVSSRREGCVLVNFVHNMSSLADARVHDSFAGSRSLSLFLIVSDPLYVANLSASGTAHSCSRKGYATLEYFWRGLQRLTIKLQGRRAVQWRLHALYPRSHHLLSHLVRCGGVQRR